MQRLSYYWGKFVQIYLTPKIMKNVSLGKNSKVCSGAIINDVSIGDYSYIGHKCCINNTEIGKFCSIAGECIIGGSNHPVDWVSTSPVFHAPKNVTGKYYGTKIFNVKSNTVIGNDVWIGSRALIKAGVKIGDGAVIGMGSVVTKDIPPFEIWAGNPAKLIRKRFDDDIINKMLASKWWDRKADDFIGFAEHIDSPADFLSFFDNISE